MDASERDHAHRPLAFDKMEGLVREMQDLETGVPVRSQKLFLTSIPSAFMGYDLIEWLMERLNIEESVEAVHIANQLCTYGYFFPVSDSKNLIVKDDSSLYRFQTPYFWPWQHKSPDNVDYAIYLAKRTLRNKQRHGLEEYEMDSLASLKKNLQNKWDFIMMQAEEQVRLAKERKKGDKIVHDSQERAYWRVHRPPPGWTSSLEPAPVPSRARGVQPQTYKKKRSEADLRKEVDFLRSGLVRTRIKVSQALDSLIQQCETYTEYDPLLSGAQPSNPWVTEDPAYWQLNGPLVEVPTEKRIRRWALSMEELVQDPTGLQEFTNYLRKEYSHENIRFWMAVNDLRRSSQSQIQRKVREIFDEFLAPGAPCEINIDGKTMERVHLELRNPTRFTFDAASDHVFTLLLKKDCYPRFIRSEQFKQLLASGIQPLQKKRFFGFGVPTKKKSTTTAPNPLSLQGQSTGGLGSLPQASSLGAGSGSSCAPPSASTTSSAAAVVAAATGTTAVLGRRRGSDRSLSGSVHELGVVAGRVSHSHSQSNLSDIPYRGDLPMQVLSSTILWCSLDPPGGPSTAASIDEPPILEAKDDICPWDSLLPEPAPRSRKNSTQLDSGSSSSDISAAIVEVSERLRKSCTAATTSIPSTQSLTTIITTNTTSTPPITHCHSQEEQRVVARYQTVRKYSTASAAVAAVAAANVYGGTGSRRASVAKLVDTHRSSEEWLECPKKEKHRKRSSVSCAAIAPMISVSSVFDDEDLPQTVPEEPPGTEESPSTSNLPRTKHTEVEKETPLFELAKEQQDEPKSPKVTTDSATCQEENWQAGTSVAVKTTSNQSSQKNTEICPWEDEESCKVDTPFVKTYATLGYL